MRESVLVLDFGSQFTQLIARRIRELGVFSEVRPCTVKPQDVDLSHVRAVIFSGGPASVSEADAPEFDTAWLSISQPILGVCYGMQLMAHHLGGRLAQGKHREFGRAAIRLQKSSALFSGFSADEDIEVWMSHGDHVAELPPGFVTVATSSSGILAAMANEAAGRYAVQFHAEVVHTPRGREILGNFLFRCVGLAPSLSSRGFIEESIEKIRAQVGPEDQVLCALSGGVDSTVAAVLVHRALGDRLHCIFVDNGLLRLNEFEQVLARLGPQGLKLPVKGVRAGPQFMAGLAGVTSPELKRKTIGRIFIEVFEAEARAIPRITHLVQGTLYPDVIESVSVKGPSATIKTHHNVGGLPDRMKLKLIEPFRELFKDEVRAVGRELGLPAEIINRQPFPGPGLAIRVLGEVTPDRLRITQEADAIFVDEIRRAGLYNEVWQSFAVLLPVQSVGVMGDGRTYEQAVALRVVSSQDGMTADWKYLPHEVLHRASTRITNEVRGVNRVVLDISSKPPATIEWE